MDYICKRKNNIKSISITADCTGPRDKEGSQLNLMPLPFLPTLDWNLRPVVALVRPHPFCLARGAKAWELEFSYSSHLSTNTQPSPSNDMRVNAPNVRIDMRLSAKGQ